ncbi:MAG: hypothetical protein A2Y61_00590 [Chloroflexi bacterium RBG_13_60_13]|nr:MAG: hypothetical protein A2Y61_00590 [Chloroflexi bacterium RBG_13_60_13]
MTHDPRLPADRLQRASLIERQISEGTTFVSELVGYFYPACFELGHESEEDEGERTSRLELAMAWLASAATLIRAQRAINRQAKVRLTLNVGERKCEVTL